MSKLEPDLAGGEADFADALTSGITNRDPHVTVNRTEGSRFEVTTQDGTVYLVTVEDVTL
jgi:hypothetical protein